MCETCQSALYKRGGYIVRKSIGRSESSSVQHLWAAIITYSSYTYEGKKNMVIILVTDNNDIDRMSLPH